jgi:hypothetical protein
MRPSTETLRRQLRHAASSDDCVHLLKSLARARRGCRGAIHPLARRIDVRALLTAAAAEMAAAS